MRPIAEKLQAWKADPVRFVRECFRAEPEAWQTDVLQAFPSSQRICLKGSKGIGKSTVVAWLGWNFLLTRRHPKVVATSISGDNLRDGLWAEMAKWQATSKLLQDQFEWNAERIVCKDFPETWWLSARQWSKTADPTQQANTLAGIHADNVLFLVEEAGGIPDGVVAAAEAGLSTEGGDTKLVMDGNPTNLSGPLYRACTRERHLWRVFEVNGDPENPKRSSRVSAQWAKEQIEKYGREHNFVKVNVFGEFPNAQADTLIGADAAGAASRRTLQASLYVDEPRVLGVDVARFGDDRSVICKRQGRMCLGFEVFRELDTMQLAGQVARVINQWRPSGTFIDVTGVGAGVVDRLRELNFDVQGVEFGAKSLLREPKCSNRRAEMWWGMAEWIKGGGCIPDDSELVGELTAPVYAFDAKDGVKLESKESMKKRGLPSPDKGDSLALTFAMPVAQAWTPGILAPRPSGVVRHEYDPLAEGRL